MSSQQQQQTYSNPVMVTYWNNEKKRYETKPTVAPAGGQTLSSAQCAQCGFRDEHGQDCPFNAESPYLIAVRQQELNAGKQGVAIPKKKKTN
jgi:hypothetical protein